jgi:hypothetical protein
MANGGGLELIVSVHDLTGRSLCQFFGCLDGQFRIICIFDGPLQGHLALL